MKSFVSFMLVLRLEKFVRDMAVAREVSGRWPKEREDVAGTVGTDVFGAVLLDGSTKTGFGLAWLEAVMKCDGGDREAALVRVHRIGCETDQFANVLGKTTKRHAQKSFRNRYHTHIAIWTVGVLSRIAHRSNP
jgi:hypothetical protein